VNGPGDVLVTTEWLAGHLDAADLCVVDMRGKVLPPGNKPRYIAKEDDYRAAHIPGAVFVDWTRDIVDLEDPVPAQIARPDAFAAKMAALGIGDRTLVVAYDDYKHIFAGRLAWALRYHGHDAVRVLDGGWARWLAEGRATSQEIPQRPRAQFTPMLRPELRRSADDVAAALGKENVLLIDARPPEQYSGAASAAVRAGHIPGARNVPYAKLVNAATGTFLSQEELSRAFADAGVDIATMPAEVIVYCNGGVSCTVPLQALQLLGRSDVSVYDGSWNEWGNDESRPIGVGPKP